MEHKPKILIVHNYYQIPGGEDTVVANEKQMLEEHGHEVILYSRHNNELKQMNKFQKLLLPITTIFNPRTYREIRKLIKQEKIDIVHVHNTLNLISPAVYYAARSMKTPVVQTVHNFRLLCPAATFYRDGHICEDCVKYGLKCAVKHNCYRGSKMQTLACVINTKIHRATGIYGKINYICLSEFTKEKIKLITDSKRIYVKPNFVYDRKGMNRGGDYYIFVGRIEKIKGVELLIDAFSSMPDKNLKIVGSGNLDDYITGRLVKEKVCNVEFMGYKTHDEVNELLVHAKALIMCSQWYETFGMVIAEAYSNALPVIGGRIGNIKDLVVDSMTGELFVYDSLEDMIAAIKKFENGLQRRYSEKAYEYYCQNLTSESNYDKIYSIYKDVGR